jgi:hypothetical protein
MHLMNRAIIKWLSVDGIDCLVAIYQYVGRTLLMFVLMIVL